MKTNLNNSFFDAVLYPHRYAKEKYKTPYILKYHKNNQGVLIIGVKHSKNPLSPQFKKIDQAWNEFLKRYGYNNIVLLGEGEKISLMDSSKTQLIKKYGEIGLLSHISNKNNVSYQNTEPDQKILLNFAIKNSGHKKENVSLWILLNIINSLVKKSNPLSAGDLKILSKIIKDFDISSTIKSKRAIPGNKANFYFSENYFLNLFNKSLHKFGLKEKIFPDDFEKLKTTRLNSKLIQEIQNPFIIKTPVNKIGSTINHARDRYISLCIMRLLSKKKNVFAVLGANHVIAQKNVVKKIFDVI